MVKLNEIERNHSLYHIFYEYNLAGAHKVLTSSKVLKKQPRGTYDYRTNGRVYLCK